MPKYIAAIDQGTTSTRCILFDRGVPVSSAQREHDQILPKPGWVEHDAVEIWQRTQEVIRDAMQAAGARADDVAAVGITNQRETTVVWDRATGKPVCNAIVWQDTRTKEICDALAAAGGQDRFREATGLPLATYFAGPKIRWILDNVPDVRSAADAGGVLFGTIDTWLIWNLTGGPRGGQHVTDPTNASRTMLMDLRTLDWDEQLLAALGVPRRMLPRIVPSSGLISDLRCQSSELPGVPICGILGDQQAALVGQCCFAPGECKNTYGTGSFLRLNTGSEIVHSTAGLVTTVAYQFSDAAQSQAAPSRADRAVTYALEGSIAVTGSLVQWLRDNLNFISTAPQIEALAETVSDNGGVYIVPAFSGLFAPYWRSDARGVICGLTRHSNKAHVARAVLEATAYQTRDVLEAMRGDAGIAIGSLKVDGGMSVNDLLMQFQADVLGAPVTRPRFTETTAQGAAYAAGLAAGFWRDVDDLRSHWKAEKTWTPVMSQDQRDCLYACWKKAVERAFGWVE